MGTTSFKVYIENDNFWEGVYGFKKLVNSVKIHIVSENYPEIFKVNVVSKNGHSDFLKINKWRIENELHQRERILDNLTIEPITLIDPRYFVMKGDLLEDPCVDGVLFQYQFAIDQKENQTLLESKPVVFKHWYMEEGGEEFEHWTPKVENGTIIYQIDAWQRNFGIGLSALKVVTQEFVKAYLGIDICTIEIIEKSTFFESLIKFKIKNSYELRGSYDMNYLNTRGKDELAQLWGVTIPFVENKIKLSLLN